MEKYELKSGITVGELIEKLSKFDHHARVGVDCNFSETLGPNDGLELVGLEKGSYPGKTWVGLVMGRLPD